MTLDELKEDSDALDSELEKATARSDKLLGERTKVSAALQESTEGESRSKARSLSAT